MNKYIRVVKTLIAGGYHPASAVEVVIAAFALSTSEAKRLVLAARTVPVR